MQMIKSSIWFWLCPMHVCMHTSHRHRQQSPRAINIIVIARFDHWTYKASKQLNEQAKHRLLYERGGNDRGAWQRQKKRERGKKRHSRSHTHHSNSCGFESKYTVCIILLSILIHLFANTIQNIVIHVIHLSTQTFRFASLSRRLFFPDASLNFIFFPHLLLIFWFGTLTLTANNTFQITW